MSLCRPLPGTFSVSPAPDSPPRRSSGGPSMKRFWPRGNNGEIHMRYSLFGKRSRPLHIRFKLTWRRMAVNSPHGDGKACNPEEGSSGRRSYTYWKSCEMKHPVLFRQVDVFRPSRSREIQQVCPGNGCSSPPIGPARLEPVFSADGPQADHRLNIFAPRHGLLLPAIRPSVNENSALSGQRRKEEVTSRIVEKYGLEGGANET